MTWLYFDLFKYYQASVYSLLIDKNGAEAYRSSYSIHSDLFINMWKLLARIDTHDKYFNST